MGWKDNQEQSMLAAFRGQLEHKPKYDYKIEGYFIKKKISL
jgi:hypothetical protein